MGVRGLEKFIRNNCPQALEVVDFSSCAEEYRRKTNSEPTLLIDGSSSGPNLYKNLHCFNRKAGHIEFGKYLMYLVRNFSKLGIKCVFFFDGPPSPSREELWIQRENMGGRVVSDILKDVQSGQFNDKEICLSNALAYIETMKYTLRVNKCEVIQTVEQADEEIHDYIAKNGCFGVLAQDTDFIIMEGVHNYFSAMELNVNGSGSLVYRPKKLAIALGIDEAFLPLFATLSGDDITSDDDLRSFHLFLLRDIRNVHSLEHLPKQKIIPRVSNWMISNLSSCKNLKEAVKLASHFMKMPQLEQKIYNSVDSYFLPDVSQRRKIAQSDTWGKILEIAEDRHREGCDGGLLTVLTRLKYYKPCSYELTDDSRYLQTAYLLEKLRRRLYGILLKERPKRLGKACVLEYIYCGANITAREAFPEFPKEHPGLLRLWGKTICTEEKMKLFLWAVSEKLKVETVSLLPQNMRLACVTIFFLANEAKKSGLRPWQVQALVALVVCLSKSTPPEEDIEMDSRVQDVIEIHISNLYTRTWFTILAVDDSCNNPLLCGPEMIFFDGMLFHNLYQSIYKGTTARDLCDSTLFDIIQQFLSSA